MINESLQFLAEQLNKYLNSKIPGSDLSQPRLIVGNIAQASENSLTDPEIKEKAVITLINIEEESSLKNKMVSTKTATDSRYNKPLNYLNLYILISINRKEYSDSLDFLSYIIQFFQNQNVFTPVSYPTMNNSLQKLIVELHSMSFEQVNHIWNALGCNYLPSVLYKVRQISIDKNGVFSESGSIKEIK